MTWLVAVCCVKPEPLSNPAEFLASPSSRIQPSWACGVVEAEDEHEAYDKALDAWDDKLLTGQRPGDWVVNWYVAPLEVISSS